MQKVVKTQEEKKDLAAKAFSDERHHGSRDATKRLQVSRTSILYSYIDMSNALYEFQAAL